MEAEVNSEMAYYEKAFAKTYKKNFLA